MRIFPGRPSKFWSANLSNSNHSISILLIDTLSLSVYCHTSFVEAKEKGFQEPVIVELVDAYNFHEVKIIFNNQPVAKSGESNFKILISEKKAGNNIKV